MTTLPEPPETPINWHRLFGLVLAKFFEGTPFQVEVEKDLAEKQTFLDVVVIRRGKGKTRRKMPDGFEDLAAHNLVSFKSHHEALDDWAVHELIGHYISYRKQELGPGGLRFPLADFRLYAISTRFPKKLADQLASQGTPLQEVKPGVFDIVWGTARIRLLVIRRMKDSDANAILQFFSARAEDVVLAAERATINARRLMPMVIDLLKLYVTEGTIMPYTLEEYERKIKRDLFDSLTPEEIREIVPAEKLLRGLPAEDRLRGLPAEDRLRGLPAEDRLRGLPDDEVLRAVPPHLIEKLMKIAKRSPKVRA